MINKKERRLRRFKKFRFLLNLKDKKRLVVYKTSRHIYAQVVFRNKCIVSCSTLEKKIKSKIKSTSNKYAAKIVGKNIAKRSFKKKIHHVVFDRSGFKYHGRVKILADYARKYGLLF